MSCVKSYTYPISNNEGGLAGIFFGNSNKDSTNVKYYITIQILGGDGNFKPVKVIADTGNDITLLTKATADYLGFNPNFGSLLEVSGIREGMVSRFRKIQTHIQLGDLNPVLAEIGFALDRDSLQENLLGNKGILGSGHYKFIYDKDSLTVVDNVNTCDSTTSMYAEKNKYSYYTRRYY